MTNAQYRAIRQKLGLNAQEMGRVLGVSPRQAQRYDADDKIPAPVAKLMRLMEGGINPKIVKELS
jgi:DNA-binding transcriptional regulator YiaG